MGSRRPVAVDGGVTAPPSDWFYPQRKRCLTCRKFFGFTVIRRLYCSYECARMPFPPNDPMKRPRECRTGAGELKRSYPYPELVTGADLRGTFNVYECACCGTYHIGHRRPEQRGGTDAQRR